MKRSAEMYKYCLTNNFGYGLTANWAMKHFLLIENSLTSDEDVFCVLLGCTIISL